MTAGLPASESAKDMQVQGSGYAQPEQQWLWVGEGGIGMGAKQHHGPNMHST